MKTTEWTALGHEEPNSNELVKRQAVCASGGKICQVQTFQDDDAAYRV